MRHWIGIGMVMATISGLEPAAAQSLRPADLPSLGLHVVGVTDAAAAAGLDSSSVRRKVQAELTDAGFLILTPAELAVFPDTPRLVFNVGILTTRDSTAVFSIQLELVELVQVKRNGIETHAVGWSERAIGLSSLRELQSATQRAVSHLLGLFLAASREAPAAGPGAN